MYCVYIHLINIYALFKIKKINICTLYYIDFYIFIFTHRECVTGRRKTFFENVRLLALGEDRVPPIPNT